MLKASGENRRGDQHPGGPRKLAPGDPLRKNGGKNVGGFKNKILIEVEKFVGCGKSPKKPPETDLERPKKNPGGNPSRSRKEDAITGCRGHQRTLEGEQRPRVHKTGTTFQKKQASERRLKLSSTLKSKTLDGGGNRTP